MPRLRAGPHAQQRLPPVPQPDALRGAGKTLLRGALGQVLLALARGRSKHGSERFRQRKALPSGRRRRRLRLSRRRGRRGGRLWRRVGRRLLDRWRCIACFACGRAVCHRRRARRVVSHAAVSSRTCASARRTRSCHLACTQGQTSPRRLHGYNDTSTRRGTYACKEEALQGHRERRYGSARFSVSVGWLRCPTHLFSTTAATASNPRQAASVSDTPALVICRGPLSC